MTNRAPKKGKQRIKNHYQMQNLSGKLKEKFLWFIEYHPAKRLSPNLRKMILEFLQHDGTTEVSNFNDLIYDLEGLFDLLDAIQAESEIKS